MVSYDCIWIKICVSIWDCQLDKIYLVSSPNPWGFSHAAWNAIAKTTCVRRACQTQSIPAFSIVNPEWFSTISIDKYHMCHCIHLFGFTNQKKTKQFVFSHVFNQHSDFLSQILSPTSRLWDFASIVPIGSKTQRALGECAALLRVYVMDW